MVVIISEVPRERTALGAMCESRGWTWKEFQTVRTFTRSLRTSRPSVVVTRHRLKDGFSDDVISAVRSGHESQQPAKIIVLLPASSPALLEARQLAVGADLTQRDPVRGEILVEYINKFIAERLTVRSSPNSKAASRIFDLAGAAIDPISRKLLFKKKSRQLSPQEVELAELLSASPGHLLSYEMLFDEILGRRFAGDTVNIRVLLLKLSSNFRGVGLNLRGCIEVIPKLGYRYHPSSRKNAGQP
jgi:DNA-binding response OmpR family regulator